MACIIDSWVPTASITEWAPQPVRELPDHRHTVVPPLLDDVGRAELERELLPGHVAAHGDDPLGPQVPGGQHGEQPDRAVPDHGHGLAWAGLGGHGAEPAGAEDVGGGEEARDQIRGRQVGGGDEGAVGQGDPQQLGLRTPGADGLPVDARALITGPADLAGVVRGEERADHELTWLDRADAPADFLDDAGVLVTHRGGPVDLLDAPVGPQVRAADAGGREPDDRVGRLDDGGILAHFDADVPRTVHDCSSHGGLLSLLVVFPCDGTRKPHVERTRETELLGVLAGPPSRSSTLVAFER
jgi:hypothetical protein